MITQRSGQSSRSGSVASLRVSIVAVLCLLACDTERAGSDPIATEALDCPESEVRMAVAASLRDVAIEVADSAQSVASDLRITTSFGASSALARQLELGAPIDVLVSADAELMQKLEAKGVIAGGSLREIARGRLVLAAAPNSPLGSLGVGAIRSPRLDRFGLPAAAVPLGRYGRAWLASEGALDELAAKIVLTENARANLTALENGHVDLALVYASDLKLRPSLQTVHQPNPDSHPAIRYVAGRNARSGDCPAVVRVLELWRSAAVADRLVQAGFERPEDERASHATTQAEGR